MHISAKPSHEVKRTTELKNRIVSRHRSCVGYIKLSAALMVPKSTIASIILKWKKFRTTNTLLIADHQAKLSNQGRRALVREVNKNQSEPGEPEL